MKATPEDVAKRITPVTRGVPSGFASLKATPEDVATTARLAALLTWACVASMKATPEDVAKRLNGECGHVVAFQLRHVFGRGLH